MTNNNQHKHKMTLLMVMNRLTEALVDGAAPNSCQELIYEHCIKDHGMAEHQAVAISNFAFEVANELCEADYNSDYQFGYVPNDSNLN